MIKLTDEQINRMVQRFLGWTLPTDFGPDCGIEFTPPQSNDQSWWPVGTNLFTAEQAKEMIKFMISFCEHDGWSFKEHGRRCPHCMQCLVDFGD